MCHVLVDWVGLALILMFPHLAQFPSRFFQIPIRPSRIRQTVEHSKSKSTNPRSTSTRDTLYKFENFIFNLPFHFQIPYQNRGRLTDYATPLDPDEDGIVDPGGGVSGGRRSLMSADEGQAR